MGKYKFKLKFKRKKKIIVSAFLLCLIFIKLPFLCAESLLAVPGINETGFLPHGEKPPALSMNGIRITDEIIARNVRLIIGNARGDYAGWTGWEHEPALLNWMKEQFLVIEHFLPDANNPLAYPPKHFERAYVLDYRRFTYKDAHSKKSKTVDLIFVLQSKSVLLKIVNMHKKEELTGKELRNFSLCADNHRGFLLCILELQKGISLEKIDSRFPVSDRKRPAAADVQIDVSN